MVIMETILKRRKGISACIRYTCHPPCTAVSVEVESLSDADCVADLYMIDWFFSPLRR